MRAVLGARGAAGVYAPRPAQHRQQQQAFQVHACQHRHAALQGLAGHWPQCTAHGPRRRLVHCRAEPLSIDISKYSNKAILDQAARRYALGLQQGFEEDELIALELGVRNLDVLPETQRPYKDKIKEKLAKRAEELNREEAEARERVSKNLNLGKKAYEYGEYVAAVKLLEQAVQDVGPNTPLGGDAQLWLALAYQACGREADCLDLYKALEASHPVRKVQKQAGELRFILEAPKLEISEEERVKIPLLQTDTWRKDRAVYTPRFTPRAAPPPAKKGSSYWERDLQAPSLMDLIPDQWYYKVAWAAVLVLLIVYLNLQAGGSGS